MHRCSLALDGSAPRAVERTRGSRRSPVARRRLPSLPFFTIHTPYTRQTRYGTRCRFQCFMLLFCYYQKTFTLIFSLKNKQKPKTQAAAAATMIKDMIDKQILELKKLWANKRQLTFQLLNLAMIVFSALMIWKALMFMTKSESPVVVVLSGSMEPAFQRGDILFLNNSVEQVFVGDVVVFKIKDRDIPIVHRILKVHEKPDGRVELLTKGDNNRVDDR